MSLHLNLFEARSRVRFEARLHVRFAATTFVLRIKFLRAFFF